MMMKIVMTIATSIITTITAIEVRLVNSAGRKRVSPGALP